MMKTRSAVALHPALFLCGIAAAFSWSVDWVVVFLLVLSFHFLVLKCSSYYSVNTRLLDFFGPFTARNSWEIKIPGDIGEILEEVDCSILIKRRNFPSWAFMYDFSRFNGGDLEGFLKVNHALFYPVRAFRIKSRDRYKFPRVAACMNSIGESIIVIGDSHDINDMHYRYIIYHELEHVSDDGQTNLTVINCIWPFAISTMLVLASSAHDLLAIPLAIIYVFLTIKFFTMSKAFREFIADFGAARELVEDKTDTKIIEEVLDDAAALWKRQLNARTSKYKRYELSRRIWGSMTAKNFIKLGSGMPYFEPTLLPKPHLQTLLIALLAVYMAMLARPPHFFVYPSLAGLILLAALILSYQRVRLGYIQKALSELLASLKKPGIVPAS